MMIARKILVTGRVQGVFFRAWSQDQAERLDVNGWVRNCSDGSVEAHLEGEQDAVNSLIELMGDGPPSSRVEGVQVCEAEFQGLTGFQTRR